jgi:site-specific DNA recombinase
MASQADQRAAIVLRVSSTGQQRGHSLETQEAGCRAFCAERGWTVAVVHEDVMSGTRLDRPGLQAVRRDLEAGTVAHVVFYDIDRAARDNYVMASILHWMEQANARLHFVRYPDLDLTSTTGEMMLHITVSMAKHERQQIAERSNRNRRARAANGAPLVGPVPLYGYQWDDDKRRLLPDAATAPIVVRIFEEVADGIPLSAIARRLTAEGVPTRAQAHGAVGGKRRVGTAWDKDAIRSIVKHPAYSGAPAAYRFNWGSETRTDAVTGATHEVMTRRERAAGDVRIIPLPTAACEPLVTPELAARARRRLTANKREAARHNRDADATLLRGGYIYCVRCRRTMTTRRYQRDGKAHWGYRCPQCDRNSLYAEEVDSLVWAHVERLARDATVTEQAMARWHAQAAQRNEQESAELRAATADAERASLEVAQISRAVRRETDERVQDVLREEMRAALDEQERAQGHVRALQERLDADPTRQMLGTLREWAAEWRDSIHHDTPQLRRQTLYRLGLRVLMRPATTTDGAGRHPIRGPRWQVVLGWPQQDGKDVPMTPFGGLWGAPEGYVLVPVVQGFLEPGEGPLATTYQAVPGEEVAGEEASFAAMLAASEAAEQWPEAAAQALTGAAGASAIARSSSP